jgi:hypothetical protein
MVGGSVYSLRGEGWWEVVFSHRELRDGGRKCLFTKR